MDNKPKTINELMVHLKNNGIDIKGNKEEIILRNIGYYHGYKGYRFLRNKNNPLPITTFNQLYAIYEYDSELKSLFYPYIMLIETAFKNITLNSTLDYTKSFDVSNVFDKALDNYKKFSNNRNSNTYLKYVKAINSRNDLRDKFFKIETNAFAHQNDIAVHFQSKNEHIPIWGIFEMISLGDFGQFVKLCNDNIRKQISQELNLNITYNTSYELPYRLIFTIKDLRNAIAHNNVIFDTRFKTAKIDNSISQMINKETSLSITFNKIFDYLALIVVLSKKIDYSIEKLNKLIDSFKSISDDLRIKIPINIYNKLVSTSLRNDINILKLYLKKA